MNGLVVRGHCCLLHSFAEGGMTMARASHILRRSAVFHGKYYLSNQFSSVDSNHVNTQDLVCFLVRDKLHHSIRLVVGAGAAVGHHCKLAGLVLQPFLFALFFRESDPRHLRMRVHDRRHCTVVDVPVLAGDRLHARHAIFLRLVGQHGSSNRVPDGTDGGNLRLESSHVDHDPSCPVSLDAHLFQAQAGGVGTPSGGHKHHIGFHLFGCAASRGFHGELDTVGGDGGSGDLGLCLDFEPLLLQHSFHGFPGLAVHARHDVFGVFQHLHFRS
mmetsp:Transcript_4794/g.30401  ORF Transcript_4794/g.30401 Transcript_4794/m.30401 type:complete len:272 (-) Transcript_4794:872-1687(-)